GTTSPSPQTDPAAGASNGNVSQPPASSATDPASVAGNSSSSTPAANGNGQFIFQALPSNEDPPPPTSGNAQFTFRALPSNEDPPSAPSGNAQFSFLATDASTPQPSLGDLFVREAGFTPSNGALPIRTLPQEITSNPNIESRLSQLVQAMATYAPVQSANDPTPSPAISYNPNLQGAIASALH